MAHIPMRMCVVCRMMRPTDELMRVVADKESQRIVPDLHKKKFGRGAYVCRAEKCLAAAEKRKTFSRHLKCEMSDGLFETLREALG